MPLETNGNNHALSRRSFLAALMGGFSALIAVVLGAPAAGFALSPTLKSGKKEEWISLGAPNDFQVGQPKMVDFTIMRKDGWLEQSVSKSVYVIRTGDAQFTVFSPRCTHLGCIISWRSEDKSFQCPCHGGIFGLTGEVQGGPPPRPLDTLEWKIDGGKLIASYKDFLLGVPDKVEA
ncbi:MAG: ubiquinol-cytochrome c reductase iron-sulfur subunit [Chloroflexota bacterium]|nr:MAG: ubiquinol-cytochrome c reductase iron-sulfur subunit [Chloroflexota bacterium]